MLKHILPVLALGTLAATAFAGDDAKSSAADPGKSEWSAKAFKNLDADNDRKLSVSELGSGNPAGSFSALDENGDGFVSETEFRSSRIEGNPQSSNPASERRTDTPRADGSKPGAY